MEYARWCIDIALKRKTIRLRTEESVPEKNAGDAKGGKSVKIATGAKRRRSELVAAPRSHRDSISLTNWTSLVFTAKGVS